VVEKLALRKALDEDTDSEKEETMKKKPTTRQATKTMNVATQNRFEPLSDHEDTNIEEGEYEHMEETEGLTPLEEPCKEKPPPIVLHGKYGLKKLMELCTENTEHGVNLKFTRDNTILFTTTMKDFKKLKEELKNNKSAPWHTYATKSERTHGFVAYGLDNRPHQDDVKNDLEAKRMNCKTVYQMKNTKYPLYVLISDNKTTLLDLEARAKTIEHIMVRWKKLINRKEIVQCHKCQKWGHAATNCYATAKCLKCANNHLTSECTLKKDVEEDQRKIKCANCGQGHLANSTDCEKYQQKKNVVEKKQSGSG
jgi:hypothetical protein